jgi:hypothetical protein
MNQCFSQRRLLPYVAMTFLGIGLVLRPGDLSPLIVVFLVAVGSMEEQFNNIFYRTPRELEALAMFPVSWRRIVLAKNLATIAGTAIVSLCMSLVILYFTPRFPDAGEFGDAAVYLMTILFPLLQIGNTRSWQEPRKDTHQHFDVVVQTGGMVITAVILSIPYILFSTLMKLPSMCMLYAAGTALYWYTVSVHKTAQCIEREIPRICTTP